MKTVPAVLLLLGALSSVAADDLAADRLRWFREDKFGMFVHWGPYSRLAGEWNGRQVPVGRNAEWIMQLLKIPVKDYRAAARQFNPVKFDAERWVRLARQAGMRYLVITAKHHDGFAMYRSRVSRYNIVDWTPFQRDPLKELAEACRRQGIRFCVYYSHREDWDDPDAYGNDWDYNPSKKNFERYLERKSLPQLRELLTGYGPLGLVWFDRGLYTPEQAQRFVDLIRSLQPLCLINGRVGNYGQELMGDYQDMGDNGMPPGGLDEYWETPQTLNSTWGYSRFDHTWKSPRTVIRRLVEIVSKGGNYLLNIGPMGDGSIPQPTVEILEKVGAWVQRNGESIYGTTASPFPELKWGRSTVKGRTLYLHVFDWPPDGRLALPGLKNAVARAYVLGDQARALQVARSGNAVEIHVPSTPPDPDDTVVVLELAGRPEVERPLVAQQGGAAIRLDYLTAATTGRALKRFNREGGFYISKWTSSGDTAAWRVRLTTAGRYKVRLTYAARKEMGGAYRIALGAESLAGTVVPTGDWYSYRTFDAGEIAVRRPGEYRVTIGPSRPAPNDLMYFQNLELVPAR